MSDFDAPEPEPQPDDSPESRPEASGDLVEENRKLRAEVTALRSASGHTQVEDSGGPVTTSCRRCGKVERIHPLDFSVCDDCRAAGYRSNPGAEKLRLRVPEDEGSGFEVLAAW